MLLPGDRAGVQAVVSRSVHLQVKWGQIGYFITNPCFIAVITKFIIDGAANSGIAIPPPLVGLEEPAGRSAIRVIGKQCPAGSSLNHFFFVVAKIIHMQTGGRSHTFCCGHHAGSHHCSGYVRGMSVHHRRAIHLGGSAAKLLVRSPY